MPETKVTISLGTENYSVTKRQLEDIEKAVKKLGLSMKDLSGGGNLFRGIIESLGGVKQAFGEATGQSADTPNKYSGRTPPIIKPNNIRFRDVGLAAMTSAFSPWLGARMFNQIFRGFPGIGAFGGGGGGGGGITKALFGQGGIPGFGEWYNLIRVVRFTSRVIEQEFVRAIQEGSRLYRESARTGIPTAQLANLHGIANATGLNMNMFSGGASAFSLRGGGTTYQQILRSAMLSGNPQNIQNVINMRKEIELLGDRMKWGAVRVSDASNAMQRISMDSEIFKSAWRGFWADLTRIAEPYMRGMLVIGTGLVGIMDWLAKHLPKAALDTIFGAGAGALTGKLFNLLFPGGGKNKNDLSLLAGPNNWQGKTGPWEKMGLIMNGGIAGTDYARQTAENTKIVADYIRAIFPMNNPTAAMGGTQIPYNLS